MKSQLGTSGRVDNSKFRISAGLTIFGPELTGRVERTVAGTMGDYTKYFKKPMAGRLAPGDDFLAGTPCLPRGAIADRVLGAAMLGVAGDLLAPTGSDGEGLAYVGQDLPSTMAIGNTRMRMVVFGLNVATGRPNKVLYDMPIAAISAVESRTGRSVGMKKLELDISLTNGAAFQLDVPREHVKKGTQFAETLAGEIDDDPAKSSPAVSETPPSQPGWYELPGDPSQQRYWDGASWTQPMRWDGTTWQAV